MIYTLINKYVMACAIEQMKTKKSKNQHNYYLFSFFWPKIVLLSNCRETKIIT